MKDSKKEDRVSPKQTYSTPRLVRYGDLRAVVRARQGGNVLDGDSVVKMNGIRELRS